MMEDFPLTGSSGLKTGSSNANSGGRQLRLSTEEDSGRSATSSGLSENSNRIHMAAGFRKRLPRTPYILRTPVLKRLRKEKKLGKRKRAETASVDDNRSAGIDLGNFAAQSSSDLRDKESGLASKPSSGGSTRRWKSAEDVSRYSDASQQATDTIVNQLGEAEASVKRWERQSREEPCTSAESNQGVVTAPRSGPFQLYLWSRSKHGKFDGTANNRKGSSSHRSAGNISWKKCRPRDESLAARAVLLNIFVIVKHVANFTLTTAPYFLLQKTLISWNALAITKTNKWISRVDYAGHKPAHVQAQQNYSCYWTLWPSWAKGDSYFAKFVQNNICLTYATSGNIW